MKSFKIILLSHTIIVLNLFFSQNLLYITTVLLIANTLISLLLKLSQKNINKIAFLQIVIWLINIYFVLSSDINLWFLSLNNFLWLLTSIKLIEAKNNIKSRNIILYMLLTIGTSALFNQYLINNIIKFICILCLIYSLLNLNNYKSKDVLRKSIILFLFIPLTFLLYIFLPKAKPWININSRNSTKIGINNKLYPGNISKLAQTKDLVARVFYQSELPVPNKRYWRLLVLDQFKDNEWYSSGEQGNYFKNKKNKKGSKLLIDNYEKWITEPNDLKQKPWSGVGQPYSENLEISDKGTLISANKSRVREEYKISSSKNTWRIVPPYQLSPTLKNFKNVSLSKLGKKWSKESTSKEEIIYKSRKWFIDQGFMYSLSPGLMNKKAPYDDFLFNKKIGFCEHFAGSFALLMRHANIPARIVVGYQGGEVYKNSENQQYILIDNSYAHAWNEVWIEGKGWIRVDPTSWISPERIQNSILAIKNEKYNLIFLTRNFRFKILSGISKIEIILNNFLKDLNIKSIIFSDNKIINRLFVINLFTVTLFLTVFLLIFEDKFSNDLISYNVRIYLFALKKYNIGIEKDKTLIELTSNLEIRYPKISKEINNFKELYNSYRFRNKSFSKIKTIFLFINLLYLELIIISYIGINLLNDKKFLRN